ncbi:hypothetical protein C7974DRAFT_81953 [Boeremia exigua]|uniref:uncharacterized protein n=1 Tax=Boeremia exigua TaxID=749465 RepID=UPI001E8CA9F5|nr:uncharacterized protein C7974DRAFT_81953 [Boeremia exigua]KAH6612641.1 hypothetical protein C7974DRAFT_81953 [Boeremia exigua]
MLSYSRLLGFAAVLPTKSCKLCVSPWRTNASCIGSCLWRRLEPECGCDVDHCCNTVRGPRRQYNKRIGIAVPLAIERLFLHTLLALDPEQTNIRNGP